MFVTLLIKFAISIALSMLLAPRPNVQNPKPSKLSDFDFPTVSDRPIQVAAGTVKIRSPNLTWYGNFRSEPIVEVIDGGWFADDQEQILAYKYFIDGQFCLCHGEIDAVQAVIINDKLVWEGEQGYGGAFSFNKPEFYGIEKTAGGVSAAAEVYTGSMNQPQSPTILSELAETELPTYSQTAHIVLNDFYVGNNTSVPNIHFVIKRLPKSPDPLNTQYIDINGNANPAYFLYEILTNEYWGRALPANFVDAESFEAAAATLHAEEMGMSYFIDSPRTVLDLIEEVCRHVNGVLRENISTGRFEFKLIRSDYDVTLIPTLSPSQIKTISDYSRGSLTKTIKAVNVNYNDASVGYQQRSVDAKNMAVHLSSLSGSVTTSDFMGFTDYANAKRAAERELRMASSNLASCKIKASRAAATLNVGDVFKLVWPALGLNEVVMRVREIDFGVLTSNEISIDCVQDVFALPSNSYADTSPNIYTPVPPAAPDATLYLPANYLLANGRDSFLVLANTSDQTNRGFNVIDAVTGEVTSSKADTPLAETPDTLGQFDSQLIITATPPSQLRQLYSATESQLSNGTNLALIQSDEGFEWIAFETVTDNADETFTLGNIHRGLLDTSPRIHTNIRVWFPPHGSVITKGSYSDGAQAEFGIQTKNFYGELPEADIVTETVVFESKRLNPLPAKDVEIDGQPLDGYIFTSTAFSVACRVPEKLSNVEFYNGTSCVTSGVNVTLFVYNNTTQVGSYPMSFDGVDRYQAAVSYTTATHLEIEVEDGEGRASERHPIFLS